jgi:hypothetical protein
VRARYRGASDAELQNLASAGRDNFTPWEWQLLEEALAQRALTRHHRPSAPLQAPRNERRVGEDDESRREDRRLIWIAVIIVVNVLSAIFDWPFWVY